MKCVCRGLPTADEWEYSFRGGPCSPDESAYHFYFDKPTNDLSADDACFDGRYPVGNGKAGAELHAPRKVGSYKPNKLGIYDMWGNVWEWTDTASGSGRVCCGGSWDSFGSNCQAAFRYAYPPAGALGDLGFRLALVPVR